MFYFENTFGLFVGKITDNKFHSHYALQLSVSIESNLFLSIKDNDIVESKAFFINSKAEHKLICESKQLTILINPLSYLGFHLHLFFKNKKYSVLNNKVSFLLSDILSKYVNQIISFEKLCILTSKTLMQFISLYKLKNRLGDRRIVNAINFMEINFDKIITLEEISSTFYLSPSRFLHLFKQETNISFRRYQLWNKLVKSLPYLYHNTITENAYNFGFFDSSHYTRTFLETFGVNPKFLKKNS